MTTHTNQIVQPYDFSQALSLSVPQRFARSLDRARSIIAANGYQRFSHFPCVPEVGGTESEISQRESALGRSLPPEYRDFLTICRYLKIDDGCEVGGFAHDGVYVTEVPWISDEHRPGVSYLVFANYWRFADGDQLMFDLSDPTFPVVAYLHEHGPLFELYAPSFSLALWRLVHEIEEES